MMTRNSAWKSSFMGVKVSEENGCWGGAPHCGHELKGTNHSHDDGVMVKPDGNGHFRRAQVVRHLVSGCAFLESPQFLEINHYG